MPNFVKSKPQVDGLPFLQIRCYARPIRVKRSKWAAFVAQLQSSQFGSGATCLLVVVWAVGAAAAGGAGAGASASLVGVVEAAALKLDAACRERFCRRSAAARTHDLGGLGHGMLNLKHVAAARALVIVARHNTSFSAQSGQIALPA